ncbi:transcription factor bHLH68 [Mercurialis annua]|uniref:transcription factor bHLH68 n=1 Tax=Mercurialis annua TaxID=3986 RepID=UPI00215E1BC3|nr:transcription factor bHLH68 [Mercurialis annua]
MNRGVLQTSSPVQQIMTGNPNWWNINNMRPPTHHHHQQQPPSPFLLPPPNLFPQFTPSSWHDNNNTNNNNQDQLPESWSQLLLGGLVDEDKGNMMMSHFQAKKFEDWEEQMLNHHHRHHVADIKQENSETNYVYVGHENNEDFQTEKPNWSQMIPLPLPVSSPNSCVTTSFSSNMLDFCNNKGDCRHPPPDRSSECNSNDSGGAVKKARVQAASTQSTFKVRKEKLGDRITALHQLVSPFGKTDTASVLLEAIGYIRFLHSQIEALSLPYLATDSSNMRHHQPSVQGERHSLFPEDPGQLLNDNCIKRKGGSDQKNEEANKKDLRSRGLCLVPVSCTLQVGSDNGADYWAPAYGGGFQ